MEDRTALSEEGLELSVLNEGHHEEEEPYGDEEQPGEGIGGPNQELVVGRRPQ